MEINTIVREFVYTLSFFGGTGVIGTIMIISLWFMRAYGRVYRVEGLLVALGKFNMTVTLAFITVCFLLLFSLIFRG